MGDAELPNHRCWMKGVCLMGRILQEGLKPALVAAVLSLVGLPAWTVHTVLTATLPPFDGPLGLAIHAAMGVLKLGTIIAFPFAIRPLYDRLQGNLRNVGVFVLFFGLGYLTLFALYILFGREPLAEQVSDGTVRFYYLHSPMLDRHHYIGLEEWRAQWARWIPQAKDAALMAIVLAGLVAPGYFFGSRWEALAFSSAMTIGVCSLLPPAIGLVLWDYDTFLGGVFFDLLSLDLLPPLWWFVGGSSIVFFALSASFYSYIIVFCRFVAPNFVDGDGKAISVFTGSETSA